MHVETIGAVVDLRDPQINKLHQFAGQTALHDLAIDTAERLGPIGSDLVVIEPLGHCSKLGFIHFLAW